MDSRWFAHGAGVVNNDVEQRDGSMWKAMVLVATWIIGVMFIVAGGVKIVEPAAFAENVYNYQAVPDAFVNPIAVFLPWLEVVIGVCMLVAPRYRLASSWIAQLLLLFFTALIVVTVMRGIDISCGCFKVGPEAGKVGWTKVAQNVGWIVVSLISVVGLSRAGAKAAV